MMFFIFQESPSFGVSDDLSLSVGDVSASASVGLNVTLEAANTAMREELRLDKVCRLLVVSFFCEMLAFIAR